MAYVEFFTDTSLRYGNYGNYNYYYRSENSKVEDNITQKEEYFDPKNLLI